MSASNRRSRRGARRPWRHASRTATPWAPAIRQAETPLTWLSRGNRVRVRIEAALREGEAPGDLVDECCERAEDRTGWRWRERSAMCWYLRSAGRCRRPKATAALCAAVAAHDLWEPERLLRFAIRFCLTMALIVALVVVSLLACGTGLWSRHGEVLVASPLAAISSMLTGWSLPVAAASLVLSHLEEERRAHTARRISVESLGVLAEPTSAVTVSRAVFDADVGVRRAAEEAIIPILGAVTRAHQALLDDAEPTICELLRHRSPAVRLAAIEALGRFAGGRAVEPVNDMTFDRNPPEIDEALARVLPILRERQRQERQAASLLRPAHAPSDGADVLLRPAAGAPTEDPALLLRAVDGEDGSP